MWIIQSNHHIWKKYPIIFDGKYMIILFQIMVWWIMNDDCFHGLIWSCFMDIWMMVWSMYVGYTLLTWHNAMNMIWWIYSYVLYGYTMIYIYYWHDIIIYGCIMIDIICIYPRISWYIIIWWNLYILFWDILLGHHDLDKIWWIYNI